MGYHETTVPEGDSASPSPDLQSSTDFFASATAIRSLIQDSGSSHPEAISDINNPGRNSDNKIVNILSSQIPPDAFYVFKKALDSGEFLTENSLDSILSYCLMKENVESLSSYMDVSEDLARRIINQQNLLTSFSQSVAVLKTRELTQTRIQRALLHIILNIHTIGLKINIIAFIGLDTNRETFSELFAAIVFGVISPNINTNTVITAVASATPFSPINPINKDVDMDVAAIFTTLFPTNIELKSLFGFSINELTNLAPLTPSSCIYLILILLNDIKAVSDAEKNADPISNTIKKII